EWGPVTVSPQGFVMDETEAEIHVTVTNTATKTLGNFQMVKAINNPEEVDIDSVRSFAVSYDYFYGQTYQGSNTVAVSADGTAVPSPDYPVGTTIRITGEAPPPSIENATWGSPEFSPREFTITGE